MAAKRFNNNRLSGFVSNRSSGFVNNRSQGFVANRSQGFVANRSQGFVTRNRLQGFVTNRSPGFVKNRLSGFTTNRTKAFAGSSTNQNITDARQLLQRKNIGHRLGGGITDLSQKLRSRTDNITRLGQRGGIVKQLYSARLNNNASLNRLTRIQNNSALRNRSAFGMKYVAPNIMRNTVSDKSKFIKVHRGGITVTAKQNILQKKKRKPLNDELEEMTLSDLPEPETISFTRTPSQSVEERLNQLMPRETNDPSATVLISNLKHSVTEEDINELFGVVGQMTSAQLLHPGAALVTYARKEDAVTALEYYNNVTLDGMAMRCTILSLDKQKTRPSITSRLGERTSSPLSASFLSPATSAHSSSSLMFPPATASTVMSRNQGRQVQPAMPTFTQFTAKKRNTRFTVCLN